MPNQPPTIEEIHGEIRILHLHGPLTISNLFDFQSRVRETNSRSLILDLSDVPYIDSAGIGALAGTYVNHSKDNRKLALVGVCDRVLDALRLSRIDVFFR